MLLFAICCCFSPQNKEFLIQALKLTLTIKGTRRYHIKIFLLLLLSSLWQKRWDKEVGNKLHTIMNAPNWWQVLLGMHNEKGLSYYQPSSNRSNTINTFIQNEKQTPPPVCDQCEENHELTVKHILNECGFLKIIRRRHYDVTDLNQLFKTVPPKKTVLDFRIYAFIIVYNRRHVNLISAYDT